MLVVYNRVRLYVISLRLATDVNQKGTLDIALMGIGPFTILLIRLPPVLRLLAMAMTFIGNADTILHLFVGLHDGKTIAESEVMKPLLYILMVPKDLTRLEIYLVALRNELTSPSHTIHE